jgi:hypothetical protein
MTKQDEYSKPQNNPRENLLAPCRFLLLAVHLSTNRFHMDGRCMQGRFSLPTPAGGLVNNLITDTEDDAST